MTVVYPIVALVDGDPLDPQWISDITTSVNNLVAPGWTDYSTTTALTASTTNPNLGNSVVASNYRYFPGSDWLILKYSLTIGSTFSAGSGNYRWSLPIPAVNDGCYGVGSSHILDNGTGFYPGDVHFVNATFVELHQAPLGTVHNAPIGSGGPGTVWATGDVIEFTVQYRTS